jgi:UDP-glucose 4-epimerase
MRDLLECVVTGGAGYIGGHLVDELVKKRKVTVIDDLSAGHYKNDKAKLVKYDLRKGPPSLPNSSVIFHLAANPDVKSSMSDPKGHYENDVTTTLNVMEAARKADSEMVIFASSSTVYGNAKKMPTPENYEHNPISSYGLFKLMGEDIVRGYSSMYGIKAVSMRFANIVGGRTGHGIIYNFANKVRSGKPVEIWGDGKQRKSYVYITDLITAISTIEKKSKQGYDTFNIGNFGTTSVNETLDALRAILKEEYKARYIGTQPGDVRTMLLDVKKLCALGWKPKYTSTQSVKMALSDLLKAA